MSIPASFVQELLARVDVVDVVGRYVPLKKSGANFVGLCPFHAEKTPSFSVSPSRQFFHCFGCGQSGDAIRFLMAHTGAGFVEAVHDLAAQHGLVVPEDDRSPQERERATQERRRRATLSEVLEQAAAAYSQRLKDAPQAIAYLKGRGLSGKMARRFGLGYAPPGGKTLAGVFADYADPLLLEAGLVIADENDASHRYDRFRDRVMFPIRNVKGEIIGFGGRVLGDARPKYLNSPETAVFHKGRELYGLFEARAALRESGFALVVEGYMDVLALAQLGFANAVATLGTACTPEHIDKLFRFTSAIVFSFDGDAAGRRAAHKALAAALPHASDTRSVKFLFLPPEHDPDSYIRQHGAPAFAQALAEAVPLSRFLLEAAGQDCDMASAEGRARFAAQARPLWQALPTGALARQLLGQIAARLELGVHELTDLWGLNRPPPAHTRAGESRGAWPDAPPRASGYAPRPSGSPGGPGGFRNAAFATFAASAPRGRKGPPPRARRALQIALSDPQAWPSLGEADHHLLCSLPAPHGPLFVWLDSQFHEHGPQPWAALRQALQGHPHAADAEQAMQAALELEGIDHTSSGAAGQDWQSVLHGVRLEDTERRMTEALAAGDTEAYRQLTPVLAQLKQAGRGG